VWCLPRLGGGPVWRARLGPVLVGRSVGFFGCVSALAVGRFGVRFCGGLLSIFLVAWAFWVYCGDTATSILSSFGGSQGRVLGARLQFFFLSLLLWGVRGWFVGLV